MRNGRIHTEFKLEARNPTAKRPHVGHEDCGPGIQSSPSNARRPPPFHSLPLEGEGEGEGESAAGADMTQEAALLRLDADRKLINRWLDAALRPDKDVPKRLNDAMRYAALGPGKRLRPILCLEAYRARSREQRAGSRELREGSGEQTLFMSGRAILDERIPVKGTEAVLMAGEEVVGYRGTADVRGTWDTIRIEDNRNCVGRSAFMSRVPGVMSRRQEQVKARVVGWPWDVVEMNAGEIEKEVGRSQKSEARRQNAGPNLGHGFLATWDTKQVHVPRRGSCPRPTLVGPAAALSVVKGARVWPGAVISTETGPVMIERGAEVRPGSFIEGPCWVGPGTVIDGAKVRPGCSFGPFCRIGGEVEQSVFQGFSNKHHDGFIGHSFVGEWANLGALTTNSDLKNGYYPVKVTIRGKRVNTGLLKVGCFIGDHAKTAIGTLLNTGAVVGASANWFESGLSPKEIPAFAWGEKARWPVEDAVECARKVMARRGVEMSGEYERRLRTLYAVRHTPAAGHERAQPKPRSRTRG